MTLSLILRTGVGQEQYKNRIVCLSAALIPWTPIWVSTINKLLLPLLQTFYLIYLKLLILKRYSKCERGFEL